MNLKSIVAVTSIILLTTSVFDEKVVQPYAEPSKAQNNRQILCYPVDTTNICYPVLEDEDKPEEPKVEQNHEPAEPEVTPQPTMGEGVEQWKGIVQTYFPAEAVNMALKVMEYESSGNPMAHNDNPATGDDSYGLFQINLYGNLKNNRPSPEELFDPEKNIAYASELYRGSGWHRHWKNTMRKLGF